MLRHIVDTIIAMKSWALRAYHVSDRFHNFKMYSISISDNGPMRAKEQWKMIECACVRVWLYPPNRKPTSFYEV